jgi:hypothetical protein
MLCIVGGVGITAILPFLLPTKPTKLFWSSRKAGLIADITPVLPAHVQVQTLVGQRFDLEHILRQEFDGGDDGVLGVLVSGPQGLADEVRWRVTRGRRKYVLVDDAFSW